MLKNEIKKLVEQTINELRIEVPDVLVDYTSDASHGDYTTNVAMIAAKKAGKNPRDLASELKEKLQNAEILEKVEVAGPGFINFWVKDKVLAENAFSNQSDTSAKPLQDKKIMVEYTDPNPFKELHIGHLYSNIIGESLSKIFEAAGATVCRVDYYGDVGMHVAKSLWGLRRKLSDENIDLKTLEEKPLQERVKYLGEAYALGSNAYAEESKVADEVKDINYLVYMSAQEYMEKKHNRKPQIDYKKYLRPENEKLFSEIKELYEKGKDWSLEYFETLYKRLGTKFDRYYPESIAGEWGYKLVMDNIENGVFVKSEGAVIFPGEKHGLHNRVFINTLGLPTYEAKELGLMPWKYEEYAYDLSFIVTATEIAGYFGVLKKAMMEVSPELGEKTKPILHGMVKLPEGKMSSRSGNVITVNALLNEAKERVKDRVSDDVPNKDETAETIGIAAVKYAFLKSTIGKDIVFDFEESVSFDGNSGPYLQYTYARTQSVLRKGVPANGRELSLKDKMEPEERNILRLINRFNEIVEEAALKYSPNIITTYLFELAQAFNLFYQKHAILKGSHERLQIRLQLTSTTGQVIKEGLKLLRDPSSRKNVASVVKVIY